MWSWKDHLLFWGIILLAGLAAAAFDKWVIG